MSVTIVTTVGSASANSYASLAEADAYFALRPNATAWTAIMDGDERSKLLLWAMRSLDGLGWVGARVVPTQSLDWPRLAVRPVERMPPYALRYGTLQPLVFPGAPGLYDLRGQFHATTSIPQGVKDAQCEFALAAQLSTVLTIPDKYKKREIKDMNGTLEYNTGADIGSITAIAMSQLIGLILFGGGMSKIARA